VRQILTGGAVMETNRAVVLAALRVTADLFEERAALQAAADRARALSDEVRPLLPPAKRH
jgi:cell division protein ZapA